MLKCGCGRARARGDDKTTPQYQISREESTKAQQSKSARPREYNIERTKEFVRLGSLRVQAPRLASERGTLLGNHPSRTILGELNNNSRNHPPNGLLLRPAHRLPMTHLQAASLSNACCRTCPLPLTSSPECSGSALLVIQQPEGHTLRSCRSTMCGCAMLGCWCSRYVGSVGVRMG